MTPAQRTQMTEPNRAARIAILIPCENEARTIGTVVADFRRALPDAQVYVYDNNSVDGTAEIAAAAGATVAFERRQGKGFVVAAMAAQTDADVYVLVDGDDTYPADRVHDLVAPILDGRADMVVGNRLVEFGDGAFRPLHLLGNRLVQRTINAVFGSRLRDAMSGYRALSRRLVHQIPIVSKGFEIETELTLQALYRDFVIEEIPVAYRPRPEGSESKLRTFRDGTRVLLKIVDILKAYRPLLFFVVCGAVAVAAGILADLVAGDASLRLPGLRVPVDRLASALEMLGLVALACGLILDSIKHHFKELSQLVVGQEARRRAAAGQTHVANHEHPESPDP